MHLRKILIFIYYAHTLFATQDDNSLSIREFFVRQAKEGMSFLQGAQAEVGVSRYLMADENHIWRARVMADVGMINFTNAVTWHTGLAMETLVDNQNDINFRLVQVYYQALTAVDWNLGSQSWRFGYRHRCSHGTDGALNSRITIRSGPTVMYQKNWAFKHAHLAVEPGLNLYIIGQNSDRSSQSRGEFFFTTQVLFPLNNYFSVLMASGINLSFHTKGTSFLYYTFSPMTSWKLEPLFSARAGLRMEPGQMKSELSLAFRQNLDSSLGVLAKKHHTLSLDLNFAW